jgi:hypothetical protein
MPRRFSPRFFWKNGLRRHRRSLGPQRGNRQLSLCQGQRDFVAVVLSDLLNVRLAEENVVSLRTVCFSDDGMLGFLFLVPPQPDPRPDGHLFSNVCWVYKRNRSLMERLRGCYGRRRDASILRQLKTTRIRTSPEIRFLWSETGQSVAVLVDGEPMAFIAEGKYHGYSKALRTPGLGNTWDEDLFQSFLGG